MALRGATSSPVLFPEWQAPNSQQLSGCCLREGSETSERPELNSAIFLNTDMAVVTWICSVYPSQLLKAWSPVQQKWRWASVNGLEDEGSGLANGLIYERIHRLITYRKWQELYEVRPEGCRFLGLAFTGYGAPGSLFICFCLLTALYAHLFHHILLNSALLQAQKTTQWVNLRLKHLKPWAKVNLPLLSSSSLFSCWSGRALAHFLRLYKQYRY